MITIQPGEVEIREYVAQEDQSAEAARLQQRKGISSAAWRLDPEMSIRQEQRINRWSLHASIVAKVREKMMKR